jgi:hypothetical protein
VAQHALPQSYTDTDLSFRHDIMCNLLDQAIVDHLHGQSDLAAEREAAARSMVDVCTETEFAQYVLAVASRMVTHGKDIEALGLIMRMDVPSLHTPLGRARALKTMADARLLHREDGAVAALRLYVMAHEYLDSIAGFPLTRAGLKMQQECQKLGSSITQRMKEALRQLP